MATTARIRLGMYARVAMLFAASTASGLMASEPGVSHALAISRAGRLSNIHYQLSFAIKEHELTVEGTESLSFDSKSGWRFANRLSRWRLTFGRTKWSANADPGRERTSEVAGDHRREHGQARIYEQRGRGGQSDYAV